jgi:hypothetical protein
MKTSYLLMAAAAVIFLVVASSLAGCDYIPTPTPTPTPTVTPTATPEVTPEVTPTPEITPEITPTPEPTIEVTPTPEETATPRSSGIYRSIDKETAAPSEAITITYEIIVDESVEYYIVDDKMPSELTEITSDAFISTDKHLKEVIISNPVNRVITVNAKAPITPGAYVFMGEYYFNQEKGIVEGESELLVE